MSLCAPSLPCQSDTYKYQAMIRGRIHVVHNDLSVSAGIWLSALDAQVSACLVPGSCQAGVDMPGTPLKSTPP